MFDWPSSPSDGQIYSPSSAVSYQWSAATGAWLQLGTSTPVQVQIVETVYTASGTWTKQPNLTYADVEVQASGGGGGGSPALAAGQYAAGGGGSAGAYTRQLFSASSLPSSAAITIGAAGLGISGASGGNAGASSFGSLLAVSGGGGGATSGAVTAFTYVAGSAGVGATTAGSRSRSGQRGENGIAMYVAGVSMGGAGGDSEFGTGGPEMTFNGATGGFLAYGYGSGGGGCANIPPGAAQKGGDGGPGIVIVREYYFSVAGPSVAYVPTADTLNRIVNPAFQVDQDQLGAGGTTTHGNYFVDGWVLQNATDGVLTVSKSTGVIISNQAFLRPTTADTAMAAAQYASIIQRIEGQMVDDLNWGTTSAVPAVLSFKMLCNVAGTYCVSIRDAPGNTVSYVGKMIVAAGDVNNWKTYTFPIPACTGGTFATDNTAAMVIMFAIACGTTYQTATVGSWATGNFLASTDISNGMASTSNTFNIADVGLYADPNNTGIAPPFVVPRYDDELRRCMRYWQTVAANTLIIGSVATAASQALYGSWTFPAQMRISPTIAFLSPSYGNSSALTYGTGSVAGFRASITSAGSGATYATLGYTANARL